MMESSWSSQKPQVFISFRGADLRGCLMNLLTKELESSGINYFIDEKETRGRSLTKLFDRIRESSVALVFFSKKYPESRWCFEELVEIKKQMDAGYLDLFPAFYKVKVEYVTKQTGVFGNCLLRTEDEIRKKANRGCNESILATEAMIWERRQALSSVGERTGLSYKHRSDEAFVSDLVVDVKKLLDENSCRRIVMKNHMMHPQEAMTSFAQALSREDLITKPPISIIGFDDRLVFLDMNSLKNPALPQRLIETGQAGKILFMLLGSLQNDNEGLAFKPFLFPEKPQKFTIVSSQQIQDESYSLPIQDTWSNDNTLNRPSDRNISSDAVTCFSFFCNAINLFAMMICPPSPRVSISFGEKKLKKGLVSLLVSELESNQISVCVEDETKQRIKGSKVSIVVFSGKYPESQECLDELVEIKTLMGAKEIDPFPIFYKVKARDVKEIRGWFRNRLIQIEYEARKKVDRKNKKSILDAEARIWGWRQALSSIASLPGLSCQDRSDAEFAKDVVTKVKEMFIIKERRKKFISYITTNLVVKKPLMHRQETAAAITTVKSMDDEDFFYSPTSFLQALNLKITELEGFKEISNGIVSLKVKEDTNLVFLNLNSLENLVRFQRSEAFELLKKIFALNPSGVRIFESLQWFGHRLIVSSQDHQIPSDTNLTANVF